MSTIEDEKCKLNKMENLSSVAEYLSAFMCIVLSVFMKSILYSHALNHNDKP